jgi:hypothetical protein
VAIHQDTWDCLLFSFQDSTRRPHVVTFFLSGSRVTTAFDTLLSNYYKQNLAGSTRSAEFYRVKLDRNTYSILSRFLSFVTSVAIFGSRIRFFP